MGQYWKFLNADNWMSIDVQGKFPGFFLGEYEANALVKLISAATVKFPKDPLEDQPYREARKYNSAKTGLCDLPCELQDAIFAMLSDPVDVFAFCLTASHFWRIGLSHYKELYMDYILQTKNWSGDRLICIGDAAEDFPWTFFTDKELYNLRNSYFDRHGKELYADLYLMWTFVNLRDVKWAGGYRITDRCQFERCNPLYRSPKRKPKRRSNSAVRGQDTRVSTTEHLSEEDEPGNDLPMYLPLYKYNFYDWVHLPAPSTTLDYTKTTILRNLSKKVYVRDDFLPLEREDVNQDEGDAENKTENEDEEKDAEPYYMSYGHLLLLRMAWSTNLSLEISNEQELCQGVWAGDRFDVVNIDAIEHEEGWTDVGAEGREQLIGIWKEKYGDEWQAEVRKWGAEEEKQSSGVKYYYRGVEIN